MTQIGPPSSWDQPDAVWSAQYIQVSPWDMQSLMTDATHLTRTLAQTPKADDLPADWETGVYDLNILTQVQDWMAHAKAHGSLVDSTNRVARLLQAAEILVYQAMAEMFKTGILLDETGEIDQNSPTFSI